MRVHPRRRTTRPTQRDWLLTALIAATTALLTFVPDNQGHPPTTAGWILLALMVTATAWRRAYPLGALLTVIALEAPYHAMNNFHTAPTAVTVVSVYSLAVAGPRVRTLVVIPGMILLTVTMMTTVNPDKAIEMGRTSGWLIACALTGEAVRVHRNYIAAIVERAERAERTREETAARRVAEERLRIARDLHDLLAHSITLIGVQTSVAAHVLTADPERLDREALAEALDGIADTCRESRGELKRTLEVLRADEGSGPPPGITGLTDLGKAAETAGASVALTIDAPGGHVPPAVGAAAYRIVQQALTNAVQHGGSSVRIGVTVALDHAARALRVEVLDDGTETPAPGPDAATATATASGFGLVGMRERARSVGGTLDAGPRSDAPGFAVRALLPCADTPAPG